MVAWARVIAVVAGSWGCSENSEKESDSGYILKTKPDGFSGRPDGKYERKRGEIKKLITLMC